MPTTTTGIATEFIQFTRASNATVTDSDGKVKWAPHNLLLNSESFDASSWSKQQLTVTANSIAAPNGTTTADTIVEDTTTNWHYINRSITFAAGITYTASAFLKAGTQTYGTINIYNSSGGSLYAAASFNLSTGAVANSGVAGTGYSIVGSPSITPIGSSGWYLCSLTFVAGTTAPEYFTISTSDNGVLGSFGMTSYLGASKTIYAWGASAYRSDLGGMQPNTSAYPLYNPTTPKNLLGFTEDFSNAAWTKTGLQAFGSGSVANATVAPNGLQTADKIAESTGASGPHVLFSAATVVANSTHTVSVYVKAAERNFVRVINFDGGSNGYGAIVNLSDQTTSAVSFGTTTGNSYSVVPSGDGWYRISVTSSMATTTRRCQVNIYLNATTENYVGDGTSGIYLWGAQLSDSASLDSYSPVYGAAVTSAAYYGPRRDFDPVTLACKGLLVEEQRANLLTYSAQFDNAAWTPTGATIAADVAGATAVAPDGTNTADKLVESNTTADHFLSRVSATQAIGTRYTLSWYVKASGRTKIRLYAYAMNNLTVFYDTATNTASYVSGGTNYSFSMSDAGSGWYRCVATSDASATNNDFAINLVSTGTTVSYAGDGTSGVLLWGAQLEANASFATSYIPTGAATATRNADVASVSTQAFPYSATEGTVVVNVDMVGTSATAANGFFNISDGTTTSFPGVSQIAAYGDTSIILSNRRANNVNATNISSSVALTLNTPFKVGLAVAVGGTDSATINGGTIASQSGVASAYTNSILRLGSFAPGYVTPTQLNGHIRQITYLPRRISNAELQTRTA